MKTDEEILKEVKKEYQEWWDVPSEEAIEKAIALTREDCEKEKSEKYKGIVIIPKNQQAMKRFVDRTGKLIGDYLEVWINGKEEGQKAEREDFIGFLEHIESYCDEMFVKVGYSILDDFNKIIKRKLKKLKKEVLKE